MARGRIPEAFIDDLLARSDIVSVITARVPLKRAGREYKACCPFHSENTPSFTVSPQKQFYHCFGCGAHGSAIGFLMEFEGFDFVDAVEELASLAGVEVPREAAPGGRGAPRPAEDASALYALLAEAESWYRSNLKDDPAAIEYLKERGLSGEIAAQFRVGSAPPAWRDLSDALGTTAERRKLLERAGLVAARDDGRGYDKFRGRVMFPIHDTRGRPVAFGGRIFGDQDGPKYLNSPETELFHKGRQLYGLYEARQAAGRPERLVVVEGYMDVLALAQHGVPEVVATLGTATTPEHARLLFRTAPEVIFCFDGDRAGRQAAGRAMESIIPEMREGLQARFLFLPEGEDPDSLVRSAGADAFRERLAGATPFSEFFFTRTRGKLDLSSLDGRAALVAACRPWLEKMPEGPLRSMMFERLGELARSDVVAGRRPKAAMMNRRRPAEEHMTPVRRAICLLLQVPHAASEASMPESVRDLDRPGMDLLRSLHDWCVEHPGANTAQILRAFESHPLSAALAKLATWEIDLQPEQITVEYEESLGMFARWANQRIDPDDLRRAIEAGRDRSGKERSAVATESTRATSPPEPMETSGSSPETADDGDPGAVPDDELTPSQAGSEPWFDDEDPGPDPDLDRNAPPPDEPAPWDEDPRT